MVKNKNEPIKYGECKAVIEHVDENGKPLSKHTTWIGPNITAILHSAGVIGFKVGHTVTISITKEDEDVSE